MIVTLLSLARQIAEQNQSTNISLFDTIVRRFSDANQMLASDPSLAKLFELGMADPYNLPDEESSRFARLFRIYINQFFKAWEYHRRGVLDHDFYAGFLKR